MILARVGQVVHEDFTVTDSSDNLVSGINTNEFTYNLYDNTGLEATSILVSFDELGNGHYRANFIPDSKGIWMLAVYHSTYFPWGKTGTIEVYDSDFDTIGENVIRALGLMQENYYLDNSVFDENGNMTSCRIRIYSNSVNVGTDVGVISTYEMNATFNGLELTTYKVQKV